MRMIHLAYQNIMRRLGQSGLTVAITAITLFIFTLVLGTMQVMQQGLELSKDRLGADVVLIPKYASVENQELLLTAAPENIYMDQAVVNQVQLLQGIFKMTPQFFAQTLALDCCTPGEEIRIIGFDPNTDFILPSHLTGDATYDGPQDIVLGSNFDPGIIGGTYLVLGEQYQAKNQLQPTGAGMDNTIFMPMETVRTLSKEHPVLNSQWQDKDPFQAVSVILVQLDGTMSPEDFTMQVNAAGIDAKVVETGETIAGVQEQLQAIMHILLALWLASLAITFLSLFGRFSALARERRQEIGLLRAVGVKKQEAFGLLMTECTALATIGGIIGVVLAIIAMPTVIAYLQKPFFLSPSVWDAKTAFLCASIGIVLAIAIGALSAIQPAHKSASMDPQVAMTKGGIQ